MAPSDEEFHSQIDPHRPQSSLSDVILGGQDGLVNVLGVILGVAAATSEVRIVLAAGVAAALAESVSMAAVALTSRRAEQAQYQAEIARERRHLERVPELEAEEVRAIYRNKGFDGELLEKIVATITANKEVWLAVMVAEELRLQPPERVRPLRAAMIVGLAALLGSALPLVPFVIFSVHNAMIAAVVLTAIALFAAGAYKSAVTVGHWLVGGLEMTGIGLAAAAIGWLVGLAFR